MLRPTLASARSAASLACTVRFGARTTIIGAAEGVPALTVALPLLGGAPGELLLDGTAAPEENEGCTVFRSGDRSAGFAVAGNEADLETAARDVYRRIFAATAGRRLHRLWNYVPRINAVAAGLENYRRFCRGRSLAFEEHFGVRFQRELPAASGVGTRGGPLAVAFVAGEAAPIHFENPQQVPAFEYPADYGPRPPSFSRATLVVAGGSRQLYISGTAAIRGHATIGANNLALQLACTGENLALIARTAGAGADLGARAAWQRTFKVYVRHRRDLPPVRDYLERHLLQPHDTVSWLQADLCRAELRVEIEAVLTK
jgi:chorismate lyase / 3-hydroxybenzoate synthase